MPGVAQWSAVQLYFAPHAHATGWTGLCRLEMQHVGLRFVEPRDREGTLLPSPPDTVTGYALTGAAPNLTIVPGNHAAQEADCHALSPFLNRENWHLAQVTFDGHPADAAQAAFAFSAIAAARTAESAHLESCPQFNGHSSAACLDVRAFLRALDLRDLFALNVARCEPGAPHLCVTAALNDAGGTARTDIRAETEQSDLPRAAAPPRIRAVAVNVGEYPIP